MYNGLMLWLIASVLAAPSDEIVSLLARMESAQAALRDATYTVTREEWGSGSMLPIQQIAVKYRQPEDLYLRWLDVYPGRAVLYREGWNGGNLRVRPGGLIPTLNLSPTGSIAMQGSRHPVWMVAMPRLIGRILDDMTLLKSRPDLDATYTDLGRQDIGGSASHCFQAVLPSDQEPALYAPQVRICVSLQSGLPTEFRAWDNEDGAFRQVERYTFSRIKVNTGLSNADFDPDNPAYSF